ncbi:MAG: carbohydrate ABC transporter permease [Treponema sp.]|jgi:ABC-type glycerol-3-phosphate transport system permease component|nr:carbohydrate ABC transporter permease [Treponema sp.]
MKAMRNYKITYPREGRIFGIVNYLIMILLLIAFLYPLLNMAAISLSSDVPVLRSEVTVYPIGLTTAPYGKIIANAAIWRSMFNSVFVAFAGCALSLVMVSIAAYPLAFADFWGKKAYTLLLIFTMWFQGGIIPTFMTIRNLGLHNSLWSLIINGLLTAYYVVIARSYFQSIPLSMVESARIDGAHDYRILFGIIIPLSKPVLATIALWIIAGHWNDYLNPLIFLAERDKYTLQLVLKEIVLNSDSSLYGLSAAASSNFSGVADLGPQVRNAALVVSMIPMIIFYPFVQRYFVSGIMLGAVKG